MKERTQWKTGPRFYLVPDQTGTQGARKCALGMVAAAVHRRDWARFKATAPQSKTYQRATMRVMALWARVFAGHITKDDARIEAAQRQAKQAVESFCQEVKLA